MTQRKKGNPRRLRRDESFLGIHFDHHMGPDCTEVGKTVSRRMVKRIIDLVGPDYIQADCKGHRGLSSYPTKAGNPAPGFVRDQLRIWRDVTAQCGVALYMHYSGVADEEAVKKHPSWARVNEDGKRDDQNTSVFSPYVHKLLIPQLRELADDYGVDGVWVDGDCWAAQRDYSAKVIKAFRAETGIRNVPKKPSDKGFVEFTEFCREGFRRYLQHYVDELHKSNPEFQIASNWSYTSFMPEPVGADVDFISGDYPLQNAVNSARLESRIMATQGKPWDLMAWGFGGRFEDRCFSSKTAVQLQQEAAIVVSMGGGFQAYYRQKADGAINDWEMEIMAEVASFCRARQNVCHKAEVVAQVAVLCSGAAIYSKSERLFQLFPELREPMQGVMQCLLDSQYSVEVLIEHQLTGRMDEYGLIVVPEWEYIEAGFKKELLSYVAKGGKLLVIGPAAAAMFRKQLGVRLLGEPVEKEQWLEHNGWLCGAKAVSQRVKLSAGVTRFGRLYGENDTKGPHECAATIAKCGKGKIAGVYLNIGQRYCQAKTAGVRNFLAGLVGKLFSKPIVEVGGSHHVDVVVARKDGKLIVNLVNTAGPHGDPSVYTYDELPTVGPLDVLIRTDCRPSSVRLVPGGRKIRHRYANGELRLSIASLKIFETIVVE